MNTIDLYHDTFKWKPVKVSFFELSNGESFNITEAKRNNYFLVGNISDPQYSEKTYAVFHITSKSLLTLWKDDYSAQVFADTVKKMKKDWNINPINFNSEFEKILFLSFPQLIAFALMHKVVPIDEDIVYTGTNYLH